MRKLLFFLLVPVTVWADSQLRIFYTSNRQGELEPCGCQVHPLGGMDRFFGQLIQLRKNAPGPTLLVDAGDTFFAGNELSPFRKDQEITKAKTIAQAFHVMGIDAMSPGQRDLSGGVPLLKELALTTGAKWVSANLQDGEGKLLFEKSIVIEKTGYQIGITGLFNPKELGEVPGIKVSDPMEAFREAKSELQSKGATFVIVLSNLGLEEDRKIAEQGGADLIVGSHSLDVINPPQKKDTTVIVQPLNQGQQLGVLDWKGKTLSAHQLIDLEKKMDSKNAITPLIEKYKKQVRDLSTTVDTRVHSTEKGKPFVAKIWQCRECHMKQYEFQQKTHHASAMLVLYARGQHFDPECVGCHTLGFQEPGGFAKIAGALVANKKSKENPIEALMKNVFALEKKPIQPLDSREQPERYEALKKRYHAKFESMVEANAFKTSYLNIQCEHCHGNRNGHPDPKLTFAKKVEEKTCRACHTPARDNNFVFAEKILKVGCPKSIANP